MKINSHSTEISLTNSPTILNPFPEFYKGVFYWRLICQDKLLPHNQQHENVIHHLKNRGEGRYAEKLHKTKVGGGSGR